MSEPTPTLDYAYNPRPRPARTWIGWVLFIGLAIMLFLLLRVRQQTVVNLALSDFKSELLSGNVRELTISTDELMVSLGTPPRFAPGARRFRVTLPQGMGAQWSFNQWILEHNVAGARINADNDTGLLMQALVPAIPWLLVLGFLWFFVFRHLRRPATAAAPLPVVASPVVTPQPPGAP